MILFLCFVYSVVVHTWKPSEKRNKHQVKILVYIVTYIHIVNKFCHDIRHKKNLYHPALLNTVTAQSLLVYLNLFLQTLSHKSGGAWPPISTACGVNAGMVIKRELTKLLVSLFLQYYKSCSLFSTFTHYARLPFTWNRWFNDVPKKNGCPFTCNWPMVVNKAPSHLWHL